MSKEKHYQTRFEFLLAISAILIVLAILQLIFKMKVDSACDKQCDIIQHRVIDWECYCATEKGWERPDKKEDNRAQE